MPNEAHDNPAISNEEILIRRINPREHVVPDGNRGGFRISSKAFSSSSTSPYGMSVDVLGLMQQAGINPQEFVTTPKYSASVKFSVGAARTVGLWVGYDPLEESDSTAANPYHAEVWSYPDPARPFKGSQQNALLRSSDWFVEIPGVSLGNANMV
jgi:hypothetical protein